MEIIFKHIWIIFIALTIVNGLIIKYRSTKYIAENAELEEGYNRYFWGWIIYLNIPWVIMMIGSLSGITQNTSEFFSPRAMNPIVLIFHFSLIVLWVLAVRWIYFKNGAEFFETHPGLIQKSGFSGNKHITAKQVKLFFPFMHLGGIIAMIIMWFIDIPILPA